MTDTAAAVVARLAAEMPSADMERLARAAAASPAGLTDLRSRAGSARLRAACDRLLACADVEPVWLAGAVAGAVAAVEQAGQAQTLDVVWTGPESDVDTGRLTAPAVVELIDDARREVLLVSYASYETQRIREALGGAVDRGVDVTLLAERHIDNPAYVASGDAFASLRLRRLVWPVERRRPGASLHAKLIVVDRTVALVGSANLTGRAMVDNLECGVLIRGGAQPAAIADHIWSLVHSGHVEVARSPG